MGKPKDPDYWKKWRAAHPEYRERERQRARARERTPEQRRAERERARSRVQPEPSDVYERVIKPWRVKNRALFLAQQRRANRRLMECDPERKRTYNRAADKRARQRRYEGLARRAVDFISPDGRTFYHDPLYEDAVATALLSLWENRWRRNRHYSVDDWVADARRAAMDYVRTERRHRWYGALDLTSIGERR